MTGVWRALTLATVLVLGALAGVVLFVGSAAGAGCTITWNGGSGDWATASDWTPTSGPQRVPDSSDSVCIQASGTYTVTASGQLSVASLTLGAATGATTQTLALSSA